jgi:hypothetical protein
MVLERPQPATAERAQNVRDLRDQISNELQDGEEQEIIFKETSPRKRRVTIYSMTDGEPLSIPRVLMISTLDKRDPTTGAYLFTSRKEEAPEYKLGEIKCFLHLEAPDRPILLEIGLGSITCPAAHLANPYSKRIHGQHRHKQEWAMYQDYLQEQEKQQMNERQEAQLKATLEIARAAGGQPKAKVG